MNATVCKTDQEYWEEGYAAVCCTHQTTREDCPYAIGTPAYLQWTAGWNYGVDEASE